jgi:hypothetical protein
VSHCGIHVRIAGTTIGGDDCAACKAMLSHAAESATPLGRGKAAARAKAIKYGRSPAQRLGRLTGKTDVAMRRAE